MPTEMNIQELRPSLIVGLGGTGKIILTRLRAYMEKHFGDVPRERIRLLELDIDPAIVTARVDDKETRLREDEYINLGDVPLEEIRNELSRGRYPELKPWFDPTVTTIERTLVKAAHQIRQAGRVAFFWHLGRGPKSAYLYKRLGNMIDELLDIYRRDIVARPTFTVYVISSLCGGTGSGMFLDIGFILQELLGPRRSYATLVGIFTTPLFYRAAPQFPLRANTWAAAQELNYFMTTPKEELKFKHIRYLPGVDVQRVEIGRPYDQVYLIDARLEDGSALLDMEAGARAIVRAVALLTTSRIGDDAASRIADVEPLRDIAKGTVFSSLASASLVFPADEIVSWCAAKGAQKIVKEELLAPLNEEQKEDVSDRLEDFLHDLEWSAGELRDSISRDEEGRPVAPRLGEDPRLRPGVLEALPLQGLYEAVRDRAKQAFPELEIRALQKMQDRSQAKKEGFEAGLEARIKVLINDDARGLLYTLEFLKLLESRLEDERRNAEAGLEEAKQSRQRAEGTVTRAESDFRDRVRRTGGWWSRLGRGGIREAREDYLRVMQALLDRTIEYRAWEETLKLIAKAQEVVETKRRLIENTRNTLNVLSAEWLPQTQRNALEAILGMDRVRERPILLGPPGQEEEGLKENLNKIYEDYYFKALEELRRKLYGSHEQPAQVSDLLGLSPGDIRDRLLVWGKEAFQDIYEIRLEDWIRRMEEKGVKTASEYLSETFGYASYMWQASAGAARAEELFGQVNTVIGLEDTENSIYAGTYREILAPVISLEGTSVVSTGDPHRITILKMGHGLRLQDFAWIEEYQNAYQQRMKDLKPIHVFPEFNLNPEGKGKERRKVFALALAYGLLEKRGARRYQLNAGEGADPQILSDKGLFDALWIFVHDEHLIDQMRQAIEDYELNSNTEKKKLLGQLNDFVNYFASNVPENERWLAEILQDDVITHVEEVRYY